MASIDTDNTIRGYADTTTTETCDTSVFTSPWLQGPYENRAERRAKGIPKMKYCAKHKILSSTHRCE